MIKLLVADDEQLEMDALAGIVSRNFGQSVEIRKATNGRQAEEIAILWGADVVLMDIEMPGKNGIQAARGILKQLPRCKIIFVTAYSVFEYAQEAVRLGANDYILKPVTAASVEAAVRRAVGQIETERRLMEIAQASEHELSEVPFDNVPDAQMATVMSQVKEYLNQNYMNAVSLDSIGDILKISPAYLSTQFKRYTGINFMDYLTSVRMNEAQKLLKDPLRSTAEVASLVGYESSSYFSRVFKKHTGMTPTQYRRQAAQTAYYGGDGS